MNQKNRKWFFGILLAGTIARALTAIFNYGYFAIDDYYILFFSVPAQAPALDALSTTYTIPGVRSMVPEYIIRVVGELAYQAGFEDPLNQIRFIFVFLGIFSIPTMVLGFKYLSDMFLPDSEEASSSHSFNRFIPLTGVFLLAFHFIMPLVSTRPLIESMSAPFLLASVYSFSKYWFHSNRMELAFAIFWLAVASTFRFQAGFCIFGLAGFAAYKSWKEKDLGIWIFFGVSGIISFFLTGLPDLILRGSLHSSLIAYLKYNLSHSNSYGESPWFAYIPSLLMLTLPPLLVGRYKDFPWKKTYGKLAPVLAYVLVFIFLHSIVPHKEERFLLPVLPLYLMLLAPLAAYWLTRAGAERAWRVIFFLVLNFFLLFMLMFFPLQRNSIGLVRYLHEHKDILELYSYKDSLTHLPVSYAYRDPLEYQEYVTEMTTNGLPKISNFNYNGSRKALFAVREDYLKAGIKPASPWKMVEKFESSPLEQIVISLNPPRNKRRSPLIIFECNNCGKLKVKGKL